MPAPESVTTPPPVGEEQTQQQSARSVGDVYGVATAFEGYGRAPSGTYATYRDMRCDPTIALARAVATAPIRLAQWSFEEQDDAPADAREWIANHMGNLRSKLLHDMLYALDYGWQPFEKVVKVFPADGGGQRYGYHKIKPLLPDNTEILQVRETGVFSGLRQGKVTLGTDKAFVFTHDQEGTDMYGRSRHENIRKKVWPASDKLFEREGMYVQKAAGIIPQVQYPEGEAQDETGKTVSTFELAKRVAENLGRGHGVIMPNTIAKWVEELALKGVTNPEALRAWVITFLEAKTAHGQEFVSLGQRYDQLKMRGWLVPERVATEGTHGTKAESESQADIAMMVAQILLEDIARYINWYLIDPLLFWNWGEQAVGTVYLSIERLVNEQKEMLRAVMSSLFSGNRDALAELLDVNAVLDMLGLPKASESVTLTTGVGDQEEMLNRLAGMGNDVTEEDAREFAASARFIAALAMGGGR